MATYNERYQNTSIELDCPPGGIRPNDLIEGVLEGSGLTVADFDTSKPFFGEQVWTLKDDESKAELFKTAKPMFKERITALYNEGYIRYGTW